MIEFILAIFISFSMESNIPSTTRSNDEAVQVLDANPYP